MYPVVPSQIGWRMRDRGRPFRSTVETVHQTMRCTRRSTSSISGAKLCTSTARSARSAHLARALEPLPAAAAPGHTLLAWISRRPCGASSTPFGSARPSGCAGWRVRVVVPRAPLGAGVLLFDGDGRLLLVRPSYYRRACGRSPVAGRTVVKRCALRPSARPAKSSARTLRPALRSPPAVAPSAKSPSSSKAAGVPCPRSQPTRRRDLGGPLLRMRRPAADVAARP